MNDELIHVTVPGRSDDPRETSHDPPGVVVHRVPYLHPDDATVVDGIPVTTIERTLIDLAEEMGEEELRGCFARASERGIFDPRAYAASRRRVEWRPSLAMLDRVAAGFV